MTSNELMIGDYVFHKDKIVKVDVLSPSDFNLSVTNEDGSDVALYKDIKGIPITPEMLEKNGFEQEINCDILMWASEDGLIYLNNLSNTPNKDWFVHIDNADRESICSADIQYVHELQHVFRLANIKKEIIL